MFEETEPCQPSDFVDPTAHMAAMKRIAMQKLPMSANTQMHRYYYMTPGVTPEPLRPGRAEHYYVSHEGGRPPPPLPATLSVPQLKQESLRSDYMHATHQVERHWERRGVSMKTGAKLGLAQIGKTAEEEQGTTLKKSVSAPGPLRSEKTPPASQLTITSRSGDAHQAMEAARQFGKNCGGILTLFAALNSKDGKSLYNDSYRLSKRNVRATREAQRDFMLNTTDVTAMTDAMVLQKHLMRK